MKIFMRIMIVLLWICVILICWMTYYNPTVKFIACAAIGIIVALFTTAIIGLMGTFEKD